MNLNTCLEMLQEGLERFFNNMDVEAWLGFHVERLEVCIDGVLGPGAKSILAEIAEPLQRVWVVGQTELVAVSVLFLNIHEVVKRDQVGLVVDKEDAGLDILDVAAVVVD